MHNHQRQQQHINTHNKTASNLRFQADSIFQLFEETFRDEGDRKLQVSTLRRMSFNLYSETCEELLLRNQHQRWQGVQLSKQEITYYYNLQAFLTSSFNFHNERMRWIFSSDCMIAIPGLIWHPRDTDSIKQSSHNNNNNKYSIHDYLGSTMRSSTTGRSHNGSLSGNIYLNAKREKKLLEFLNLILTFFYWKLLRVKNLVTYAFYHLRYWEYERLDFRVCNVPCTMTIIIHCYCTSHNNLEPMLQTLTHIQSTQHVWL